RHVAVVARVAHGGGEDAVDEDRAAFLVHFVLDRLGVLRDLDDDGDFLGRVASGIDLVEAHLWLRCECGWWKPAILRPAVLQCTKRRGRAAPAGTPGRDLVAGRGLEARGALQALAPGGMAGGGSRAPALGAASHGPHFAHSQGAAAISRKVHGPGAP